MSSRCGRGRADGATIVDYLLLYRAHEAWTGETEMARRGDTAAEAKQGSRHPRSNSPQLFHHIMSQSRPPSDTEEQHSPPTSPLKETVNGTPPADDQCPNLDDEVSVARGVGAFASVCLPHTLSCVHSMSCLDLAIPQKREREASLEPPTPHPDDTVRTSKPIQDLPTLFCRGSLTPVLRQTSLLPRVIARSRL